MWTHDHQKRFASGNSLARRYGRHPFNIAICSAWMRALILSNETTRPPASKLTRLCHIIKKFSPLPMNKNLPDEKLILATGASVSTEALTVAESVEVRTTCWAVTARPICESGNKLKVAHRQMRRSADRLRRKNSADDLSGRGAQRSQVVNSRQTVLKTPTHCAKLARLSPRFSPRDFKSVLNEALNPYAVICWNR